MSNIDISFGQQVQGAGAGGAVVPIFRSNSGVNSATATPKSRGGGVVDPMGDIDTKNLDPYSSDRDIFDAEYINLQEFVTQAIQKGYDPTKIDGSDPNSLKVAREFQERKQVLKKLADGLRLSFEKKSKTTGLFDIKATGEQILKGGLITTDYSDIVVKMNQTIPSSGYKNEQEFEEGVAIYNENYANLIDVYRRDRQSLEENGAGENAINNLTRKFSNEMTGLNRPFKAGMTDLQQENLRLSTARFELEAQKIAAGLADLAMYISQETMRFAVNGEEYDYNKQILSFPQVTVGAGNAWVITPLTTEGYGRSEETIPSNISKKSIADAKIDRYEILPVDASGRPRVSGLGLSQFGEVAGFKVFGVGSSNDDKGRPVPTYIDPDLTANKQKGKANSVVYTQLSNMKKQALLETQNLKSGEKSTSLSPAPRATSSPLQSTEKKRPNPNG